MIRTPETTTSSLSMADETSPSQEPQQEPSSQQPAPEAHPALAGLHGLPEAQGPVRRRDAQVPQLPPPGDVCQTTDPRKPEVVVTRKWPAKTSRLLADRGLATEGGGIDRQPPASGGPRGDSESVPDVVETEGPQTLSNIHVSFLTRAYHASNKERRGERSWKTPRVRILCSIPTRARIV
ncbi:hypothetical protein PG994_002671 [Apiospora phragmitis]|uniref:Uncharacterized protein n=1 Tax=Apiospora phragmitis TaxID=2905665 RepID=A0ABR1W5T0_9PEZI